MEALAGSLRPLLREIRDAEREGLGEAVHISTDATASAWPASIPAVKNVNHLVLKF